MGASLKNSKFYLHADVAKQILLAIQQGLHEIEISIDLNISRQTFAIENDSLVFDRDNMLDVETVKWIIKKKDRIFTFENNELQPIEIRDSDYYKLVPTTGPPTFEINGIKMHRSKDMDPFEDTKQKAAEVVRHNDLVLDTCGGLGYTAIWAMRLGAKQVISVEHDKHVRELRQLNPWSQELFNQDISLVAADIFEYITTFDSFYFDSIIHDPPRFSLAGNLYGHEFYAQLLRVLKKGGKLFHYTGNPYLARKGNAFLLNAVKRLQHVGFRHVSPKPLLLGVSAQK
jgi:predicted methyltransferase